MGCLKKRPEFVAFMTVVDMDAIVDYIGGYGCIKKRLEFMAFMTVVYI